MARTQTMVQLNDDLVARLDRESARRGVSRSALIRDLLDQGLHDDREAAIGRAIAEGYARIPPGTPDEWGDLEAEGDAHRREVMARLDSEEREARSQPW